MRNPARRAPALAAPFVVVALLLGLVVARNGGPSSSTVSVQNAGASVPSQAGPADLLPPLPQPLLPGADATPPDVGFNQSWPDRLPFNMELSSADVAKLKAMGATQVRLSFRCYIVLACSFERRYDDTIDYRYVTTWNFTFLDQAISELISAGITPVIAPIPGDRQYTPGVIVDDQQYASTTAFIDKVVTHIGQTFGPLPYSLFETDLGTAIVTDSSGVKRYRYLTAQGFPATFAAQLQTEYGNNIANLNAAYGAKYTSFSQVPVPDLGSNTGVPASVYDNPATTDLRRIIGWVSASRYSAIGQLIHQRSPGSEFWGPEVQLQSFDTTREVHTAGALTTVGPTLSDLASQPGIDVLSVDGYRNNDPKTAAAEWRIAAKMAADAGKKVAIVEIGAQNLSDLQMTISSVQRGGSNLRSVLLWQGKDTPYDASLWGALDRSGNVKPGYGPVITQFFTDMRTQSGRGAYVAGKEGVFYPEWGIQVVQNGKLTITKTLALMGDLMAAGYTVEPLNDADVAKANWTGRLSTYSLYMSEPARQALANDLFTIYAYQYASERTGFANGQPVDKPLFTTRDNFTVSAPETTTRPPETVKLLGQSFMVTTDYRTLGFPFVHINGSGLLNTLIGTHSNGAPMAIRTVTGSEWTDEYVGPQSLPTVYGTPS